MKLNILFSLFILGLFASCGQPSSHTLKKERNLSPALMESIVSQQSFFCSDADFCPEGLGRLFTINFTDNKQSQTCSAFLVADDMVMTNSHCLWAGDISLAQTCGGLFFAFRAQDGSIHQARCSEIVFRDRRTAGRKKYTKGFNDIGLVKLDQKLKLTHLSMSRTGMVPGKAVHPVVMDQMNESLGRLTKLDCTVEKVDKYGVARLGNCPVISGNSGSAVLDENQHVIGLIFASSDNHAKTIYDPIEMRKVGTTKAFAFTMDYIQELLSEKLPL